MATFVTTMRVDYRLMRVSHRNDGRIAAAYDQDVDQQLLQLKVLVIRHQLQMLHERVVTLNCEI